MHTPFLARPNQSDRGVDHGATSRARCARFPTRIIARLDGAHPRRLHVIDVSKSGLLAAIDRGELPPLRYAVQITVATPSGLQLTLMAVVARHTTSDGMPAMGLKLFPLDRAREALWYAVVEAAAAEPSENVAVFNDGDPLDELEITVEDLVDLGVALELALPASRGGAPSDVDGDDLLFVVDKAY